MIEECAQFLPDFSLVVILPLFAAMHFEPLVLRGCLAEAFDGPTRVQPLVPPVRDDVGGRRGLALLGGCPSPNVVQQPMLLRGRYQLLVAPERETRGTLHPF